MNQLGSKIKRLREEKLLSRKDLAQILQCSVSHAINIEKGSTGLSDGKKHRLSQHFDLPSTYFDTDDVPIASEYDINVGRNIKEKRKEFNLTQDEFAEEIGYSGSAVISALESGKRSISKKKLIEVADFFGVHIAELLFVKSTSTKETIITKSVDMLMMISLKILNHFT